MLPSRGLSRSNPASALRFTKSARTQSARPLQVPIRHFSQAQSRSILLRQSRSTTSTPISLTSPRTVLAATTSSVFTQSSGASRNLSLWPFSSKKNPPAETQSISSATSPESWESVKTPAPETPAQEPPTQDVPFSSTADHVDPSSAQPESNFLSDLEFTSILDIPEQIGYLKSLGLEFGWGPTACCEWLIEHIYVYTGMPWWAVLTTVAFAWRAAFFVPTLKASKHQALLQKLTQDPAYIQAKAEFDEAVFKNSDIATKSQARIKLLKLKKESGASTLKSLASLWSFPFSWGMFRLVRAMAAIPVPSLETGGMLWFTDFTVHDPYFILPLTSVAITVLMFKQTQAANMSRNNELTARIQKGMIYILPPTMFLATAWLPAGLQWFFLMFTSASVIQSTATLNPAIRRWADIPPLPRKPGGSVTTASEAGVAWQPPSTSPGGGIMESLLNSAETKKKEQWKKAQDYEERRSLEEKEKAYRRMDEVRRQRARRRGS
ncbi:60Kd inner membrane protein-domain-containing protein [Annulohypoxylon moriforme]|nr:60Kd inner membrane protein-domain-containing protein [Annulohypoxylon moriforme]